MFLQVKQESKFSTSRAKSTSPYAFASPLQVLWVVGCDFPSRLASWVSSASGAFVRFKAAGDLFLLPGIPSESGIPGSTTLYFNDADEEV